MKRYFSILVASAVCSALATGHALEPSGSSRSAEGSASITSVAVPAQLLAPLQEAKQTQFGSAHWIKTTVDISASGHLDGRIRVWSKHFFLGYTGTALVYLRDAQGNILLQLRAPSTGVNGECFGRSDVTKTWSFDLPAVVRDHVARIQIVNFKTPQHHDLPKYLADLDAALAKLNVASIAAACVRYAKQ